MPRTATVRIEEIGRATSAIAGDGDSARCDSSRAQLPFTGRRDVEEEPRPVVALAIVALDKLGCLEDTRIGGEGVAHLRSDLVAAGADGRPDAREQFVRPAAEASAHDLDGAQNDATCSAAPAGM